MASKAGLFTWCGYRAVSARLRDRPRQPACPRFVMRSDVRAGDVVPLQVVRVQVDQARDQQVASKALRAVRHRIAARPQLRDQAVLDHQHAMLDGVVLHQPGICYDGGHLGFIPTSPMLGSDIGVL